MKILADGNLLIQNVTRADAGKFTCIAENFMGTDSITHELSILGAKKNGITFLAHR